MYIAADCDSPKKLQVIVSNGCQRYLSVAVRSNWPLRTGWDQCRRGVLDAIPGRGRDGCAATSGVKRTHYMQSVCRGSLAIRDNTT